MGRAVGVVHTVGPVDAVLDDVAVGKLQVIANQTGTRLGLLRVFAETQLQASTDGLTGLLNRRALENKYRILGEDRRHATVVMCDLDRFKELNDTYGHETGDRALRLFAEVLRSSLRTDDLLSRYGGEEFAVVLPDCDLATAQPLVERLRVNLGEAVRSAGLPTFTASFGMVAAEVDEDLETALRRADEALFEAKRTGRDRIVSRDAQTGKPDGTPRDTMIDADIPPVVRIRK